MITHIVLLQPKPETTSGELEAVPIRSPDGFIAWQASTSDDLAIMS